MKENKQMYVFSEQPSPELSEADPMYKAIDSYSAEAKAEQEKKYREVLGDDYFLYMMGQICLNGEQSEQLGKSYRI